MNNLRTNGKRVLKGDIWHDDNGPLPNKRAPDAVLKALVPETT